MRHTHKIILAISAAVAAGAISPSLQAAGSEGSGEGVHVPPLPHAYPGSYDLDWTIEAPILSIEQRERAFKAPTLTTRAQRWDFSGPVVRTERRKLWSYPDFRCKYVDWTVSNECRTVWRGVYADLPRVVMRRQHVVVDVPDWRIRTWTFPLVLPRWTWKTEHWAVSLPAFAPEAAR